MKETLLLLKDLLGPYRTNFINVWLQYRYVYIDNLADTVNKYNYAYHSAIKMKPPNVKSSTYIGFSDENNNEDATFEVDDYFKISKYNNIFAKCDTPSWSGDVFVIFTSEFSKFTAESFATKWKLNSKSSNK